MVKSLKNSLSSPSVAPYARFPMYSRRPSSAEAAAASVAWAEVAAAVPLVASGLALAVSVLLMDAEARLSARLSTAEDILKAEDTKAGHWDDRFV